MDISTTAIPRISIPSDISRIVALNLSMLTTLWSLDVDAFAPLPGLGHQDRIQVPVGAYNQSRARYLIIGGANSEEKTYEELNVHTLRQPAYGLMRSDGIHTKAVTKNTFEQLTYVMNEVKRLDVQSLAIFTSPYHLLRAFGTAIRMLDTLHMKPIPIVPICVGSLEDFIPESLLEPESQTGHDMVAGEVIRFFKYSKRGDVAEYDQIRDFMSWMRSEHPALAMAA